MSILNKQLDEIKKARPIAYWLCRIALIGLGGVFIFTSFYWITLFVAAIGDADFLHLTGVLGDSFGFWNSVFSGAALILVIISVNLQARELSQVSQTFQRDSFERTFFNMISLFNDQSDELNDHKPNTSPKYISDLLDRLRTTQLDVTKRHKPKYNAPEVERFLDSITTQADNNTTILDRFSAGLGYEAAAHCMNSFLESRQATHKAERFLQITINVLNFICSEVEKIHAESDDEKSQKLDRLKYADIFWSQLLDSEIEFLMIYAFSDYSGGKGYGWKLTQYFQIAPPNIERLQQVKEKHLFLVEHFEQQ